jgi:stress-induced morphogen
MSFAGQSGKNGKDVALVIKTLRKKYAAEHPRARIKAYRYNPASIRVRIIDPDFAGKDRSQRHKEVWPILEELPEEVQADLMLLLLLTPEETGESSGNTEFEHPSPDE